MGLPKPPAVTVSASGVSSSYEKKSSSNTRWLSSDPNELCDRLNLFLQEKQAGNIFEVINEKIVVIVDKIFEYNYISTKQQKLLLVKSLNELKTKK